MTRLDFLDPAITLDDQGPVVHFFASYGLVQKRAKRVLPQHANDQRRLRLGKGLGGPLDKLSKVEQENSFNLMLAGWRCFRRQTQCSRDQPGRQMQPKSEPGFSAAVCGGGDSGG